MFPVKGRKNRVGMYVIFMLGVVQKCMFHAYFMLIGSWKDREKLNGRVFLSKNLLGWVTGNK